MKMPYTMTLEQDLISEVDQFLEDQKNIAKIKVSRSSFVEEAISKLLMSKRMELSTLKEREIKRTKDASIVH